MTAGAIYSPEKQHRGELFGRYVGFLSSWHADNAWSSILSSFVFQSVEETGRQLNATRGLFHLFLAKFISKFCIVGICHTHMHVCRARILDFFRQREYIKENVMISLGVRTPMFNILHR
jgi:hypothetical protein